MMTLGDGHYNGMFFNFMGHINRTAWESKKNFTVVHMSLDPLAHQACTGLRERLSITRLSWEENYVEEIVEQPPPPDRSTFLRRLRSSFAKPPPPTIRRELRNKTQSAGALLRCVNLAGWLPPDLFQHRETASTKGLAAGTGSCSYNMIIWTKPWILQAALKVAKAGVLMIDTDVVVKKDIIAESLRRLASNPNLAMVTGMENTHADRINTGTVFLMPGKMATTFCYAWVEQNNEYLNDDHGDQAAFQATLDHNDFLKPFTVTYEEAVGQCSRPGTVATHYNCWANKLRPMIDQGDWDEAAQSERKKLGLLDSGGVKMERMEAWTNRGRERTISTMEAAGDWLVQDMFD